MKISDAALVDEVTDEMKIPTGEVGDKAVSVEQLKAHINAAPVLQAEAVLDFPNTVSGAQSSLDIACPGAVVGDPVALGAPVVGLGLYLATVTSADIITVVYHNTSGVSNDPVSATFRVLVFKVTW